MCLGVGGGGFRLGLGLRFRSEWRNMCVFSRGGFVFRVGS